MKIIEMQNICKAFGDTKANKDVCFDLQKGEIHALLGENGAGKTTLMNILYGLYCSDAGQISIKGSHRSIRSPRDSIALGIGMVHQHFMLIPQLTVTQNIFLGLQKETGFHLDLPKLEKTVAEYIRRFGFHINPKSPVWKLPVGLQQKVEILKALIRNVDILILDEPTAVLTPHESEELFSSLKEMTKEGYSIILITHKMYEVMEHSDRVTVMRQGEVVGTVQTKETDKEQLAAMMIGKKLEKPDARQNISLQDTILSVEHLSVKNNNKLPAIRDLSFHVSGGEILGIAGVDGNGQVELGEALTSLRKAESGSVIRIKDQDLTNADPGTLIDIKVSNITEDRQRKGLVMDFTAADNLILGSQRKKRFSKGVFINRPLVNSHAQELMESYDIRPRKIGIPAKSFSGGNQQKIILAREMTREPELIIALQPTRGLDIGATNFVWNQLMLKRNEGKAVLLISTDLDEIYRLSDRIAVIYEGRFTGIVSPDTSAEEIGLMMSGVENASTSEQGGTA